jgi:O-antigen/teichoic acid export membrane protein
MSRLRNFLHSLVSGYVLLGMNVIYTLASVPLALHYLTKAEFGLWALTSQLGGYMALLDFGMRGSVSRILVDYKDRREGGHYGSLVRTGAVVGTLQGLLVLVAGTALSSLAGGWLGVSRSLSHYFFWLMAGQSVLLATSFATDIFRHILAAHQRSDIISYCRTASMTVSLATLWVSFATRAGVFSLLWASGAAFLVATSLMFIGCLRLKLFPLQGEWGRPTMAHFKELFAFGGDVFLFSLGAQLVSASQAVLLTRWLGLEAAAAWSVCTRAYALLIQVIYNVFDYSTSALAEMIVRSERERLLARFRAIDRLSINLALVAGVLFAVCNSSFVSIWTAGKMKWEPVNDWILGAWLVVSVSVHNHTGLVGQTKSFKLLRWLFFLEGLAFVGLASRLVQRFGITGMLAASLICSVCFTFPYGLVRTRHYFGLKWIELIDWYRTPLLLMIWVVLFALSVCLATRNLAVLTQLVLNAGATGALAAGLFLRYGLEASLRSEMIRRSPTWARAFLIRLLQGKPDPCR